MDSIRQTSFQSVRLNTESFAVPKRSDEEGDQEEQNSKDGFVESLLPAEELDEEEEHSEGERHESELLEKYALWENEAAEALLDDVFLQLKSHMQRRELQYDMLGLDTDTPFASSCPNGAIYFSRALLEALTPEQVLFFAAHELAHTELRHYATRKRRLAELRQVIPAPPGSSSRQRLELAAVLTVRHQEEFEADFQAGRWVGRQLGASALTRLHELCLELSPKSLQRPTHPPFEKRVSSLKRGEGFPSPLQYLYTLVQ